LFRALGHPEWLEDERFGEPFARSKHLADLGPLLDDAFRSWATEELVARLEAEQVPFGMVRDLDDMDQDPQIVHNGSMRVRKHPVIGRIRDAKPPVRFSATVPDETPLAPSHGQHNDEVLRELGRGADDIAALRSAGTIL
jgi:crotonobetainyl-CoA:carnitine CoA-transferase CaiB-like acyl-CoA transferase